MNTFCCKRRNIKWSWQSHNRITKSEIDFISGGKPDIVRDVDVLGKIRSNKHRMVRSEVRLNLKKERGKQAKRMEPSMESVRARTQEFKISLQNSFGLLTGENEDSVDTLYDNLTTAIKFALLIVFLDVTNTFSKKFPVNLKGVCDLALRVSCKQPCMLSDVNGYT